MKKIVTTFFMKQTALFVGLFLTIFTAQAQVPQAVCYQAVATNQQGVELVSQAIRVRLSVLKTSAAGPEEWVETHNVTTDGFGLFDLNIGMGTRTGGAQTSFSGIKWGADKYFLKVEMDIAGGSNFVLMGVNQLISVPYALYADRAAYADSAKVSAAGLTTILNNFIRRSDTSNISLISINSRRADTALYANYSVNSRRSDTANYATYAVNSRRSDTSNYSLFAVNARRADTAQFSFRARFSDTAQFAWLADSARRAARAGFADTATAAHRAVNAQNAVNSQNAVNAQNAQNAVNSQNAVNAQNAQNAVNSQNAVNAQNAQNAVNAQLAQRATNADTARVARTALDDFDRDPTNEIQRMSFNENTGLLSLTRPNGVDTVNFSSAVFRAPGAAIDYPFGILGTAVMITQNYTVPAGKTLFISATNNAITLADGKRLEIEPGMPIIPSGTAIRDCFCTGLLVDNQPYATPLIIDFAQSANFEYFVPDTMCLIIKSGTNGTARDMSFQVDGVNFSFYSGASSSARFVVIPGGKRVRRGIANVGSNFVVTGYLLKKN
jgi:hypothetical protein